jgi:hypothetical protein
VHQDVKVEFWRVRAVFERYYSVPIRRISNYIYIYLTHTHTHTHTYIYTHDSIYFICVFICFSQTSTTPKSLQIEQQAPDWRRGSILVPWSARKLWLLVTQLLRAHGKKAKVGTGSRQLKDWWRNNVNPALINHGLLIRVVFPQ